MNDLTRRAPLTLALTLAAMMLTLAPTACGGDDAPTLTQDELQAVVNQYALIVERSYAQSLEKTQAHQRDITAFLASPSEAGLQKARSSWLAARDVYGQTEAYRFYDGPIDGTYKGVEGPEGKINAWPLDENYIDYVEGKPDAGLINDTSKALTQDLLVELNEVGGETNISTGYHAVEFLLWGQDLSATGPGARPHTDYVDQGTASNQDRRRQFLGLVTQQLIDDLTYVHEQWLPDKPGNYRAEFTTGDPRAALGKMIQGMGNLSGAELAGERMEVALENRDQEDEHSCFSDNTHNDIIANALSIQNIYLGRFGDQDGPGIDELVAKLDPALDTKLKAQLERSVALTRQIPVPFDQAILNDAGRAKIEEAVAALREQTKTIGEAATLLGLRINLEE